MTKEEAEDILLTIAKECVSYGDSCDGCPFYGEFFDGEGYCRGGTP